jgi:hypothetical protein
MAYLECISDLAGQPEGNLLGESECKIIICISLDSSGRVCQSAS